MFLKEAVEGGAADLEEAAGPETAQKKRIEAMRKVQVISKVF